ncbi:MAG: cellulase family glycosylhydrolase [Lentisphaerae bacterium]|jgi:hypothetical protein|nr:cellulase family glycosylhydrolase [Lentisphaerota bacterium]MBT5610261.1 cellulase family glycosylhydrolase [Lentisphaerota bacterium]MBT7059785.1 cellulase family glycosylhydrolase [Lentisphaerota bacterium]MBT7842248.1 cellulase family glycosylhydrolase [Lentisphaerota bacterium]
MTYRLAVTALLLTVVVRGQPRPPVVSPLRTISPSSLARTAEFTFQLGAEYQNPYDPDEIRVDAAVTGPTGRSWAVPAFWMAPCVMRQEPPTARFSALTLLQFYIGANEFPRGKPVSFSVSQIVLVNSSTGQRRKLHDLTDLASWTCRKGATLQKGVDDRGEAALIVTIVPDGQGYPGIHLVPGKAVADWSAYDTLAFRSEALTRIRGPTPKLEIRTGTAKHSVPLLKEGAWEQGWKEHQWCFNRRLPLISWAPALQGEWRLRIAAPITGDYTFALTATNRVGTTHAPPQSFHVARTARNGFIRVAPECPRYLSYESGKPFFSVGTNLLVFKDDFAEYVYYIDRFTDAGVNLFRVWLNTPCLGFEKEGLIQYGPRECAVLDALLNHADQRSAAVMLCQLDFREVAEKKNNPQGGWERNPYSTVCDSAADFFTDKTARTAFRKRLRYLVARWSASPAVHSWEFFNEVNGSDAWRLAGAAPQIRAWHAEMAEYLRSVDPYKHLLTTSFSNPEDDPIHGAPWLELVQPHCYQTAAIDFASFIRPRCLELAHHGKPMFPGEFGLMTIKFEDVIEGGVSIHNGMWASVMSGCAGTAMPWWWQWIDRHDYYSHFAGLSTFVQDVRWHEQAFRPIRAEELRTSIAPTSETAPETVSLALKRHTWDATALYNRPARIEVRPDGTVTPEDALSTRLHGVRNHADCHNPKTIVGNWPVSGRLVVSVGTVSGYGGANLRVYVDDTEALTTDFLDEDEALQNVMHAYRGDYAVDIPAGKHEIRIENTGNDWITLDQIRLENYGTPGTRCQTMGLRGRDTALLWLRNTDYTWFGALAKQPCHPIQHAQLTVRGMSRGRYVVRFYSPTTATWRQEQLVRTRWGKLDLTLPDFRQDLAIRICREAAE